MGELFVALLRTSIIAGCFTVVGGWRWGCLSLLRTFCFEFVYLCWCVCILFAAYDYERAYQVHSVVFEGFLRACERYCHGELFISYSRERM